MDNKSTFAKIGRDKLNSLLSECTLSQVNIFNQMYKNVETMDADKIEWAIKQVERTIEKNKKKE